MLMKKTVLFICTHNSARSQMAEGLVNHYFSDRFKAFSAGTAATGVNPYAVKAMSEKGIDISHHRSKSVQEFAGKSHDYVVTVCDSARESCPFFPGKNIIHHSFRDPSGMQGSEEEILNVFRVARDEIHSWIKKCFINA